MRVIVTIIVALFVLFIITFSLENTDPVTLRYYDFAFLKGTLPVYMLIFVSFLAGVVFTGFMGTIERFRLTRTISRLNRMIRDLRRELKAHESDRENGGKESPLLIEEAGEKAALPAERTY